MIVQLLPCWSLSVYRGEIISSLQKRRPCLLVTIQSHAPRSPYTSCTVHGASVDLSQSFRPTPGLCCCSLALSTPRECRPKGTTPNQTKHDKTISEKNSQTGPNLTDCQPIKASSSFSLSYNTFIFVIGLSLSHQEDS